MPALCMVWLNATEHFSDLKYGEVALRPGTELILGPKKCSDIYPKYMLIYCISKGICLWETVSDQHIMNPGGME